MDFLICQTSAASPAEPGELLFWFRNATLSEIPSLFGHGAGVC
jgi:hypothetical protein